MSRKETTQTQEQAFDSLRRQIEQGIAAQILVTLVSGQGGKEVAELMLKALHGAAQEQQNARAELLQRLDLRIGAFEAHQNGHILDAEQKRDILGLWEGLNDLYIYLAKALEEA